MSDGLDHNERVSYDQEGPAIVYHNPVAQRRADSMDWMKGVIAFALALLSVGAMYLGVSSFMNTAREEIGSIEEPAEENAEGSAESEGGSNEEGSGEEGQPADAAAEEEQPQSPPAFTSQKASSELESDATSTYVAANAVDGNKATAWNEGSSGDGVGEWIELSAERKQHVEGIRIAAGYQSDEGTYYNNRRPREIQISFDDYTSTDYELDDLYGETQTITFDEPKDTTTLRVTIVSTYAGYVYNDCCISELRVF